MTGSGKPSLAVFLTKGVPLSVWAQIGIMDRELAIYRTLAPNLARITLVTHGNAGDLQYRDRLGNIRLICNRWSLPPWLYAKYVARSLRKQGGVDLVKTNQAPGGDLALVVGRSLGARVVARCGYLPSNIFAARSGENSSEVQQARRQEKNLFSKADISVVATDAMRDVLHKRYGVDEDRVRVIPNYVDTDKFRPMMNQPEDGAICFVGRLEAEKNVLALVEALKGLPVRLDVVGKGPLEAEMRQKAAECGVTIKFLGVVPNDQLPGIFNKSSLYLLPSLIEHHPKALIEAMACGLPVIGTDVEGIRDLIQHRENGYLCGTSTDEIRAAIRDVLKDRDLAKRMGKAAHSFAHGAFALGSIAERELSLYGELTGKTDGR